MKHFFGLRVVLGQACASFVLALLCAGCVAPKTSGYGAAVAANADTNANTVANSACRQVEHDEGLLRRTMGWSAKTLRVARQLTGLSAEQLCRLPPDERDKARANAKQQIKADANGMREYFRSLQLDASGNVPVDGLSRAVRVRQAMLTKQDGRQVARAGLREDSWQAMGPLNSYSGRVTALYADPRNSRVLLVGTSSGGVWRSGDAGVSWRAVDSFFTATRILADPANPDILYASSIAGVSSSAGIWRSTDNGITWRILQGLVAGQVVPGRNGAPDGFFNAARDLAISPADPRLMVVTTLGGILVSRDSGVSWQQVAAGTAVNEQNISLPVTRVVSFDPNNPHRVLVGTHSGSLIVGTDLGMAQERWQEQRVAGLDAFVSTMAWSGDGRTVWLTTDEQDGTIYRSVDGGNTFSLLGNPKYCQSQCWYNNLLWVDPGNPNRVILGGVFLYRSEDGGLSWDRISSGKGLSWIHSDHHAVVADSGFNSSSNRTVYFGNDGGVFRTKDIAAPISELVWENVGGSINSTEFYTIAANAKAGVVLGGTQDNGSFRFDAGTRWTEVSAGDGSYVAIPDASTPLYASSQYLSIMRIGDHSYSELISDGIKDKSLFIAPLLLDPNFDQRMYAGATALWVSDDVRSGTPLWRVIKPAIDGETFVSAIAVVPGNAKIVWVGYSDGSLHVTLDASQPMPTWTQVRSGNGYSKVTSIFIGDALGQRITVSLSGYGGIDSPNVVRSSNGGASWDNIGSNLPSLPAMSIVEHPDDANRLYVGTLAGLFISENGGASWSTSNMGPAHVAVMMLQWYGRSTLLAGTFGRGVWRAHVGAASVPGAPATCSVSVGNGVAHVSFTPVEINDGGSAVTSYTVIASPGGNGVSGNASPIMVNGLSNGTSYTFTVHAANGVGSGTDCVIKNVIPAAVSSPLRTLAAFNHTAVIGSDGQLWTWGENSAGQLGVGTYSNPLSPQFIGDDFMSVATGFAHTLALKRNGQLWAWGDNASGQLGDATVSTSAWPILIGSGYVAIAAGIEHSLALKNDGSLWAWGGNHQGQLGNGGTIRAKTPVLIGAGFAAIATGGWHSLALKEDGSLWAWGSNGSGELGDGSHIDKYKPVAVRGYFVAVNGGYSFSTAIDAAGQYWGWGANFTGQLGGGGQPYQFSPKLIGSDFQMVASGDRHALGIKQNGQLLGWGDNSKGQFDDAGRHESRVPTLLASDMTVAAAGNTHSVALRTDGSILTWGANDHGQLGDGSVVPRSGMQAVFLPKPPGTPQNVIAIPGNASASVRFTAGGNAGAANASGWTVTAMPGNIKATGSPPWISVGGLINGVTYTFAVTASNANGESAASMASPPVMPSALAGNAVVLVGKRNDYEVTENGRGVAVLAKLGVGGTQTYTREQRLYFADRTLALDVYGDGNAGKAYRLYQAAFNRVPDSTGLGFWMFALDQGSTLEQVAAEFINSPEFKNLYGGNQDNAAFVTALYANVLHRTPDAGGFQFWMNSLRSGATRRNLLAQFSDSDENRLRVKDALSLGVEYTPYLPGR